MIINSAYAATDTSQTNTETGATGGDHGGGGAFPPFDSSTYPSQLLWLAITFGLFYFMMSRVVIPRISSILEVRRDRISQDLDEANRLKEESDAAIAAYEHELAEAKAKASAIANEARDKAKADADAERAKVEAELTDQLSAAEAKIAEIKTKAMAEVGTIAGDTTTEIVKALIGGTVSKADVTKAVKSADTTGN